MNFREFFTEAGKILSKQGIELSRVNKQDFLTAKAKLNPILQRAGLTAGWTAGGAGSFDPEHPYGGGGRDDSGDIDILIDPVELIQKFPKDIAEYVKEFNARAKTEGKKPIGDVALNNALAIPAKKSELQISASKWELAKYMSQNGYETTPGTLTLQYSVNGKNHSVDLILRPKSAWELHTHDFTKDAGMRGSDLWLKIYPLLAKLASKTKLPPDPKTGEEKGNLQFSPERGVVDRNTNEVITSNKNEIAKLLLGPDASAVDLASLSGIKNKLMNQPEKWNAIKEFYPIKNESMDLGVLMEGIDHPEDNIINNGYEGAEQAFKQMSSLVKNSKTVTIKWDGFPAIIFGWKEIPSKNNPNGQFLFVDKHMFDKMAKSKLEFTSIEDYDKGRGANRQSLWEAAAMMVPTMKKIVPMTQDQYFFGDLMWSGMPKIQNGYYVFEPNTVKYQVKIDSDLGNTIGKSVGGIAIHTFIPSMGAEDRPLKGLQGLKQNNGITFLVGEIKEKPKIALSTDQLSQTQEILNSNKHVVKQFVGDLKTLKSAVVLSSMSPFITSMLRDNDIASDIVPRFLTFLKTRLSEGQSIKLLGINKDGWLYKEGARGLIGIWSIWAALTELKLNIKKQIDLQQTGLPVQARIGEEDSHEGYVFGSGANKLKLIDRLGFSKANFAKNNVAGEDVSSKLNMPAASFCFGRMNPPTVGHKALMQKTIEKGGTNSFIFLSNTQNSKKDPLNPDIKSQFVKLIYPEFAPHVVDEKVLNPIYAANYLYAKGFRNLIFIAGSDRLGDNQGSLEKLLTSWNSGAIRTKDTNFGPQGREQVALRFVSSGDRDPDATEGDVSGISASLARKLATEGNEQGFYKATGVSSNLVVAGKNLYQAVREGMGLSTVKPPVSESIISFKEFLFKT